MSLHKKALPALIAALVALGLTLAVGNENTGLGNLHAAGNAVQAPAAPAPRYLPDFSQLVQDAGPAVVNISVVQLHRETDLPLEAEPGDPFYDFFKRFGPPGAQGRV